MTFAYAEGRGNVSEQGALATGAKCLWVDLNAGLVLESSSDHQNLVAGL